MKFLNRKIMKWNIYSRIILKIVEKNFHTFVNGCVYDIKYKNLENNEEFSLSITLEYMKINSQFFRIKNNQKFSEKFIYIYDFLQLTKKLFSSLSKINICFYIKVTCTNIAQKIFQKNITKSRKCEKCL